MAGLGSSARIFGVDADADECGRFQAGVPPGAQVTYVPFGLGAADGSAARYLTKDPACSSLFPPVTAS